MAKENSILVCDRVIFWSLVWFVFFVPLTGEIGYLAGFLALAFWIRKMVIERRVEIARTPLNWLLLAFFGLGCLSIFQMVNFLKGLQEVWEILCWGLLLLLVASNIKASTQVRKLMIVFLASASVVGLIALIQLLTGMDHIGLIELWFADPHRYGSTIGRGSDMGTYLILAIPVGIGLLLYSKRWRERMLLGLSLLILAVPLAFLYCRGAWLGVIGGVLVMVALKPKQLIPGLLVLAVLLALFLPQGNIDRFKSTFDPYEENVAIRASLYKSALRMVRDHPFLGVGIGNYEYRHKAYRVKIPGQDRYPEDMNTHNSYLQYVSELGLPGLGIFLAMLFYIFRQAFRLFKTTADGYLRGLSLGLIGSFTAFSIHSLFDNCFYTIRLSSIFWFLVGIMMALKSANTRE